MRAQTILWFFFFLLWLLCPIFITFLCQILHCALVCFCIFLLVFLADLLVLTYPFFTLSKCQPFAANHCDADGSDDGDMTATWRRMLLASLLCLLWNGAVWAPADEFRDVMAAERGLERGNEVFAWQAGVSADATKLLVALRGVSVRINTTSSKAAKMQNSTLKADVAREVAEPGLKRKDTEIVAQNVENMKGTVPKDGGKIQNEPR